MSEHDDPVFAAVERIVVEALAQQDSFARGAHPRSEPDSGDVARRIIAAIAKARS